MDNVPEEAGVPEEDDNSDYEYDVVEHRAGEPEEGYTEPSVIDGPESEEDEWAWIRSEAEQERVRIREAALEHALKTFRYGGFSTLSDRADDISTKETLRIMNRAESFAVFLESKTAADAGIERSGDPTLHAFVKAIREHPDHGHELLVDGMLLSIAPLNKQRAEKLSPEDIDKIVLETFVDLPVLEEEQAPKPAAPVETEMDKADRWHENGWNDALDRALEIIATEHHKYATTAHVNDLLRSLKVVSK